MKSKVYYDDGSTSIIQFGPGAGINLDSVTPLRSIRKLGVVAIVSQNPDTGWVITSGADYYIQNNGHWIGVDFFGLIDFLRINGYIDWGIGWKRIHVDGTWVNADLMDVYAYIEKSCPVLFGRWTTHNEFAGILQRAENDREFGNKNGWLRDERTPKHFSPPP